MRTKGVCINCKRELKHQFIVLHHMVTAQKLRELGLIGKFPHNTVRMCKPCEKYLHKIYPNEYLDNVLNNAEAIVNDSNMKQFAEWISNKNIFRANLRSIEYIKKSFEKDLNKLII